MIMEMPGARREAVECCYSAMKDEAPVLDLRMERGLSGCSVFCSEKEWIPGISQVNFGDSYSSLTLHWTTNLRLPLNWPEHVSSVLVL